MKWGDAFDKTVWKPSSLPRHVVDSASFRIGTTEIHNFRCYTIPSPNCSNVSRLFYSAFVTTRELSRAVKFLVMAKLVM